MEEEEHNEEIEEEAKESADEEADEEETSEGTDHDKPEPKQEFILHYERLCRGESNRVCKARSGARTK